MTIERVANNVQAQFLLSQINNANAQLNESQAQIASGKVASDYAGYGDKTATLEAARSAANRAEAYKAATQLASNQADLQDTQLTTLSNLAGQLRQALTTASANNDGSSLMSSVQSIFDQALQVLNSKDANGNYLFGGDKNDTAPVTVSTLADLEALPSASAAFVNGTVPASVNVADGQSMTVGVLASDAGTQLMQAIKDVADFNASASGPFSGTLTGAQASFVSSEIPTATTAASSVTNVLSVNGDTYNSLKDAISHQDTLSTLYKNFTSDIEDVDMPTAITKFNLNQTALQAALQVTSQLNNVTLLNYLK
jgi:flagellar hook-associated protein 3 FlgL